MKIGIFHGWKMAVFTGALVLSLQLTDGAATFDVTNNNDSGTGN